MRIATNHRGHYSDAVEASFKKINSRIKEEVRRRTGKVCDGADLINTAFSVENPDDQTQLVEVKRICAKCPGNTAMILVLGEKRL